MKDQQWVLVASSRSGPWQTDLDRGDDGTWHLIVDHPPVYICVVISSPSVITAALRFLNETLGKRVFSEFEFGQCLGCPLMLVKDDEFSDRYFVKMWAAGTICQFALGSQDVRHIRQLLAELEAGVARGA